MIVYIEDENSEIYTEEIINFTDSFVINTIHFFSPEFHIFKHLGKMFDKFPHLKEFEVKIRWETQKNGRIGIQSYWSRKKGKKVFSHFWS